MLRGQKGRERNPQQSLSGLPRAIALRILATGEVRELFPVGGRSKRANPFPLKRTALESTALTSPPQSQRESTGVRWWPPKSIFRRYSLCVVPVVLPSYIFGLFLPALPAIALVSLDFRIYDAPLQDSESVPARLAPEGINVEDAHQTFRTNSTDSFNIIAGTLGTNRLSHVIFP